MAEKNTDDLSRELMEAANLDAYLAQNEQLFTTSTVTELLNEMYQKKQPQKAALARQAAMSEVYVHQILSGRRLPSRDRLICLCLGLEATLEETQTLLKRAGYAPFYPKVKRDAIIAYGIIHHTPLPEINDKLFLEGEKTLF